MPISNETNQILALEERISSLTATLVAAKNVVTQCVNANSSLSQSAAEARAKNQGAGRGILGGLLGSKFRGAMRAGAAASNAAIAKEVAEKRAHIANGKRQAQEYVRQIQAEITVAKQELRALTSARKSLTKVSTSKTMNQSLDLLQKLKNARDAGLLTEEEFEQKRKKLVSEL